MKLRLITLLWAVLFVGTVTAQMADEPLYYPYAEREEQRELPEVEYALFERAIASAEDLYTSVTAFQLPSVSLYRRGEGYDRERSTLHGVPIRYQHLALLRGLGATEQRTAGIALGSETVGATGGGAHLRLSDDLPLQPFRVVARYADRNYRVGADLSYKDELRSGWQVAAAAIFRTGRDARVEGVFTNRFDAGLSLRRSLAGGGVLAVVATVPFSMRGMHAASTEEAFRLTDDPYYNPAWGLQNGRVRSARVRREVLPQGLFVWQQPLTERTRLNLSFGGEYGLRKQSALGWYDARTLQPDNYRKMPSYTGDAANDEAWRSDDHRYTQIAWDELIEQNRLLGGSARYALEDRVERTLHATLRVGLQTQLEGVELHYGLLSSLRNSRSYKEMRDLLGADYLLDIDHYLIDDDTYANQFENNLRNPSRRIGKGDRFGYDYALLEQDHALWLRARHVGNRLRVEAAAELGHAVRYRRGYYEKELFSGRGSYGLSRRIERSPYTFKAAFGWSFSARCHADLTLAAGAELPATEHLFVQPLYNNRTVDRPTLMRYEAARLQLRGWGEKLEWQLTGFATLHRNGLETVRYYDDLAGVYGDLIVEQIATSAVGIEGALRWRINYHWTLQTAASWGRYRYLEDPRLTLLRDTDNALIEERAKSHMADCRVGGVPTATATLGVHYYGAKGWGGRLSVGGLFDRFVETAWTRRTDRIARQNGNNPESLAAFARQERMADAVTLDVMLSKSIRLEQSTLHLMLSARNLTAAEYPAYGYESMRTQQQGSSIHRSRIPQANRYRYAAPRSVVLTVGYRF